MRDMPNLPDDRRRRIQRLLRRILELREQLRVMEASGEDTTWVERELKTRVKECESLLPNDEGSAPLIPQAGNTGQGNDYTVRNRPPEEESVHRQAEIPVLKTSGGKPEIVLDVAKQIGQVSSASKEDMKRDISTTPQEESGTVVPEQLAPTEEDIVQDESGGPVSVRQHILDVTRETLRDIVEDGESEAGDARPWPFTQSVVAVLCSLAGCEIEGRELSFAMILASASNPEYLSSFLDRVSGTITFMRDVPSPNIEETRKLMCRDKESLENSRTGNVVELLAQYPGGLSYPLLFLGLTKHPGQQRNLLGHCCPVILKAHTTTADSPSALYAMFTREAYESDVAAAVVWMKPARAVRVYNHEGLRAHFLRVRKTQMWACRKVEDLTRFLERECARRQLNLTPGEMVSRRLYAYLVDVLVELSESGKGGAVYLVRNDFFDKNSGEEKLITKFTPQTTLKKSHPELIQLPLATVVDVVAKDGATFVSSEGKLLAAEAYMASAGGRHKTALEVCCKDADARRRPLIGLIVSQDGDVSVTAQSGLLKWGFEPLVKEPM